MREVQEKDGQTAGKRRTLFGIRMPLFTSGTSRRSKTATRTESGTFPPDSKNHSNYILFAEANQWPSDVRLWRRRRRSHRLPFPADATYLYGLAPGDRLPITDTSLKPHRFSKPANEGLLRFILNYPGDGHERRGEYMYLS